MAIGNFKTAYILHHVHEFEDGHEDIKLIGVFSTKIKALESLDTHQTLLGFKDHTDGFSVDEYAVDRASWNEGFITVD